MLELNHIYKSYQKGTLQFNVFENLNLCLPKNGFVLLCGRSGIGKTTLLNIIGGFDKITKGEIRWNHKLISNLKEKELTQYRNTEIAFVSQDSLLFENLTVWENYVLFSLNNIESADVFNTLKFLKIDHLKKKKIKELSGGERQRVALFCAIYKQSSIILCDEITSNVDLENSKNILSILKEISKQKLIIVSSHDIETISQYADIIYDLEKKKIIKLHSMEENACEEIKEKKNIPKKFLFQFAKTFLFENKLKFLISLFLILMTMTFYLLSSTIANFNIEKSHAKTMLKEKENVVFLENNRGLRYSNLEIQKIKNTIDGNNLEIGFTFKDNQNKLSIPIATDRTKENSYYSKYFEFYFFPINDSTVQKNKILGCYPKSINEIMLPQYLVDLILYYGLVNENNEITYYKDYEDFLLNNVINVGNLQLKVVGIIEQNISLYTTLKELPIRQIDSHPLYPLFVGEILIPSNNIYITQDLLSTFENEYTKEKNRIFCYVEDKEKLINLFKEYPISSNENPQNYKITTITKFSMSISNLVDDLNYLTRIFIIIALISGIISIIVSINYIENSIDKHKKEIQLLKSLGIQNNTIQFIFILEAIFIHLFGFIISLILSTIFNFIANYKISKRLLFSFLPFNISWINLVMLFIMILVLCFIITILLTIKFKKIYPKQIN